MVTCAQVVYYKNVEGADEEEGYGVPEHEERREDCDDGGGFDAAVGIGWEEGSLEALGLVSEEGGDVEDE